VEVEYPLGHRRRRSEGIPLLMRKCRKNLSARLSPERVDFLMELFGDRKRLAETSADTFMEYFTVRET
jgi:2-methylcitrate dehydratase